MSSGFGYQDPLETWSAKFGRKFKENPWVPLGGFLVTSISNSMHL